MQLTRKLGTIIAASFIAASTVLAAPASSASTVSAAPVVAASSVKSVCNASYRDFVKMTLRPTTKQHRTAYVEANKFLKSEFNAAVKNNNWNRKDPAYKEAKVSLSFKMKLNRTELSRVSKENRKLALDARSVCISSGSGVYSPPSLLSYAPPAVDISDIIGTDPNDIIGTDPNDTLPTAP